MPPAAIQHLYAYHFAANRKIWNECIVTLTEAQFTAEVDYSVGSIRNHIVHLMNVDSGWFTDLRGETDIVVYDSADFTAFDKLRSEWDKIETTMKAFLDRLDDETLKSKPIVDPMAADLTVGQALLHVANHGTDHRAQLLMLLNQAGVKTFPQDYFFYLTDPDWFGT